jgi:hypothetical protein
MIFPPNRFNDVVCNSLVQKYVSGYFGDFEDRKLPFRRISSVCADRIDDERCNILHIRRSNIFRKIKIIVIITNRNGHKKTKKQKM